MSIGDIPFSGYLLCYGPLALTIFGFIAFAYLTDRDARRPYLRIMDMRKEEEREGWFDDPEIDEPFDAETPSGHRVTVKPSE